VKVVEMLLEIALPAETHGVVVQETHRALVFL
jgi:hypothetical protein